MCHQTLQDAQCARARLYLWPVVQTKGKVTTLFRAAVNASPGEQMGVCSTSGPLRAVLPAPTALEGARGDVCALLPRSQERFAVWWFGQLFRSFWNPRWAKVLPDCGHSSTFMLVVIPQRCVSFLGFWPAEISWHPRRPAALCKVLACFPRPAQGSVNPSCVSQIPSVFVRQQRGHLLMTFHVFTGVVPGVGGKGSRLRKRQVRKGKLKPVNWDQYLCCVLQQDFWGRAFSFEDCGQICRAVSSLWTTLAPLKGQNN